MAKQVAILASPDAVLKFEDGQFTLNHDVLQFFKDSNIEMVGLIKDCSYNACVASMLARANRLLQDGQPVNETTLLCAAGEEEKVRQALGGARFIVFDVSTPGNPEEAASTSQDPVIAFEKRVQKALIELAQQGGNRKQTQITLDALVQHLDELDQVSIKEEVPVLFLRNDQVQLLAKKARESNLGSTRDTEVVVIESVLFDTSQEHYTSSVTGPSPFLLVSPFMPLESNSVQYQTAQQLSQSLQLQKALRSFVDAIIRRESFEEVIVKKFVELLNSLELLAQACCRGAISADAYVPMLVEQLKALSFADVEKVRVIISGDDFSISLRNVRANHTLVDYITSSFLAYTQSQGTSNSLSGEGDRNVTDAVSQLEYWCTNFSAAFTFTAEKKNRILVDEIRNKLQSLLQQTESTSLAALEQIIKSFCVNHWNVRDFLEFPALDISEPQLRSAFRLLLGDMDDNLFVRLRDYILLYGNYFADSDSVEYKRVEQVFINEVEMENARRGFYFYERLSGDSLQENLSSFLCSFEDIEYATDEQLTKLFQKLLDRAAPDQIDTVYQKLNETDFNRLDDDKKNQVATFAWLVYAYKYNFLDIFDEEVLPKVEDVEPLLLGRIGNFTSAEIRSLKELRPEQWHITNASEQALFDRVQEINKSNENDRCLDFSDKETKFIVGVLEANDQQELSEKLKAPLYKQFKHWGAIYSRIQELSNADLKQLIDLMAEKKNQRRWRTELAQFKENLLTLQRYYDYRMLIGMRDGFLLKDQEERVIVFGAYLLLEYAAKQLDMPEDFSQKNHLALHMLNASSCVGSPLMAETVEFHLNRLARLLDETLTELIDVYSHESTEWYEFKYIHTRLSLANEKIVTIEEINRRVERVREEISKGIVIFSPPSDAVLDLAYQLVQAIIEIKALGYRFQFESNSANRKQMIDDLQSKITSRLTTTDELMGAQQGVLNKEGKELQKEKLIALKRRLEEVEASLKLNSKGFIFPIQTYIEVGESLQFAFKPAAKPGPPVNLLDEVVQQEPRINIGVAEDLRREINAGNFVKIPIPSVQEEIVRDSITNGNLAPYSQVEQQREFFIFSDKINLDNLKQFYQKVQSFFGFILRAFVPRDFMGSGEQDAVQRYTQLLQLAVLIEKYSRKHTDDLNGIFSKERLTLLRSTLVSPLETLFNETEVTKPNKAAEDIYRNPWMRENLLQAMRLLLLDNNHFELGGVDRLAEIQRDIIAGIKGKLLKTSQTDEILFWLQDALIRPLLEGGYHGEAREFFESFNKAITAKRLLKDSANNYVELKKLSSENETAEPKFLSLIINLESDLRLALLEVPPQAEERFDLFVEKLRSDPVNLAQLKQLIEDYSLSELLALFRTSTSDAKVAERVRQFDLLVDQWVNEGRSAELSFLQEEKLIEMPPEYVFVQILNAETIDLSQLDAFSERNTHINYDLFIKYWLINTARHSGGVIQGEGDSREEIYAIKNDTLMELPELSEEDAGQAVTIINELVRQLGVIPVDTKAIDKYIGEHRVSQLIKQLRAYDSSSGEKLLIKWETLEKDLLNKFEANQDVLSVLDKWRIVYLEPEYHLRKILAERPIKRAKLNALAALLRARSTTGELRTKNFSKQWLAESKGRLSGLDSSSRIAYLQDLVSELSGSDIRPERVQQLLSIIKGSSIKFDLLAAAKKPNAALVRLMRDILPPTNPIIKAEFYGTQKDGEVAQSYEKFAVQLQENQQFFVDYFRAGEKIYGARRSGRKNTTDEKAASDKFQQTKQEVNVVLYTFDMHEKLSINQISHLLFVLEDFQHDVQKQSDRLATLEFTETLITKIAVSGTLDQLVKLWLVLNRVKSQANVLGLHDKVEKIVRLQEILDTQRIRLTTFKDEIARRLSILSIEEGKPLSGLFMPVELRTEPADIISSQDFTFYLERTGQLADVRQIVHLRAQQVPASLAELVEARDHLTPLSMGDGQNAWDFVREQLVAWVREQVQSIPTSLGELYALKEALLRIVWNGSNIWASLVEPEVVAWPEKLRTTGVATSDDTKSVREFLSSVGIAQVPEQYKGIIGEFYSKYHRDLDRLARTNNLEDWAVLQSDDGFSVVSYEFAMRVNGVTLLKLAEAIKNAPQDLIKHGIQPDELACRLIIGVSNYGENLQRLASENPELVASKDAAQSVSFNVLVEMAVVSEHRILLEELVSRFADEYSVERYAEIKNAAKNNDQWIQDFQARLLQRIENFRSDSVAYAKHLLGLYHLNDDELNKKIMEQLRQEDVESLVNVLQAVYDIDQTIFTQLVGSEIREAQAKKQSGTQVDDIFNEGHIIQAVVTLPEQRADMRPICLEIDNIKEVLPEEIFGALSHPDQPDVRKLKRQLDLNLIEKFELRLGRFKDLPNDIKEKLASLSSFVREDKQNDVRDLIFARGPGSLEMALLEHYNSASTQGLSDVQKEKLRRLINAFLNEDLPTLVVENYLEKQIQSCQKLLTQSQSIEAIDLLNALTLPSKVQLAGKSLSVTELLKKAVGDKASLRSRVIDYTYNHPAAVNGVVILELLAQVGKQLLAEKSLPINELLRVASVFLRALGNDDKRNAFTPKEREAIDATIKIIFKDKRLIDRNGMAHEELLLIAADRPEVLAALMNKQNEPFKAEKSLQQAFFARVVQFLETFKPTNQTSPVDFDLFIKLYQSELGQYLLTVRNRSGLTDAARRFLEEHQSTTFRQALTNMVSRLFEQVVSGDEATIVNAGRHLVDAAVGGIEKVYHIHPDHQCNVQKAMLSYLCHCNQDAHFQKVRQRLLEQVKETKKLPGQYHVTGSEECDRLFYYADLMAKSDKAFNTLMIEYMLAHVPGLCVTSTEAERRAFENRLLVLSIADPDKFQQLIKQLGSMPIVRAMIEKQKGMSQKYLQDYSSLEIKQPSAEDLYHFGVTGDEMGHVYQCLRDQGSDVHPVRQRYSDVVASDTDIVDDLSRNYDPRANRVDRSIDLNGSSLDEDIHGLEFYRKVNNDYRERDRGQLTPELAADVKKAFAEKVAVQLDPEHPHLYCDAAGLLLKDLKQGNRVYLQEWARVPSDGDVIFSCASESESKPVIYLDPHPDARSLWQVIHYPLEHHQVGVGDKFVRAFGYSESQAVTKVEGSESYYEYTSYRLAIDSMPVFVTYLKQYNMLTQEALASHLSNRLETLKGEFAANEEISNWLSQVDFSKALPKALETAPYDKLDPRHRINAFRLEVVACQKVSKFLAILQKHIPDDLTLLHTCLAEFMGEGVPGLLEKMRENGILLNVDEFEEIISFLHSSDAQKQTLPQIFHYMSYAELPLSAAVQYHLDRVRQEARYRDITSQNQLNAGLGNFIDALQKNIDQLIQDPSPQDALLVSKLKMLTFKENAKLWFEKILSLSEISVETIKGVMMSLMGENKATENFDRWFTISMSPRLRTFSALFPDLNKLCALGRLLRKLNAQQPELFKEIATRISIDQITSVEDFWPAVVDLAIPNLLKTMDTDWTDELERVPNTGLWGHILAIKKALLAIEEQDFAFYKQLMRSVDVNKFKSIEDLGEAVARIRGDEEVSSPSSPRSAGETVAAEQPVGQGTPVPPRPAQGLGAASAAGMFSGTLRGSSTEPTPPKVPPIPSSGSGSGSSG